MGYSHDSVIDCLSYWCGLAQPGVAEWSLGQQAPETVISWYMAPLLTIVNHTDYEPLRVKETLP